MKTIHKLTTILNIIAMITAFIILLLNPIKEPSTIALLSIIFLGLGFILYFLVQDIVIGFLSRNKISVGVENEQQIRTKNRTI